MVSNSGSDISAIDKVIVVCSALVNLCPSVISLD